MFNRFQSLIRDYFGLSHKEARGVIVLLVLTFFLLLLPYLYRFLYSSKPIDPSAADQRKLDSLVALMKVEEAKQPNYRDHPAGDKTTAEHFSEPKLFHFDPNTVSVAGWQQLGLPKWLAERIDKYRSKGGQFRKKEDLLRIYDFPADLYDQLEPYITLKDSEKPSNQAYERFPNSENSTSYGDKSNERPAYAERVAKPVLQPFDINTADTTQLIALKGIGVTLAGRIVKYRDALGGFISTDQFRDVYGLDSMAVEEL